MQEVRDAEGLTPAAAEAVVSQAIDRWVWYAGWSDKYVQILGGLNPVAGPYFNISASEPTGVVAIVAPQSGGSLLGLVSVVAPAIVSGNTVVVVEHHLDVIAHADWLIDLGPGAGRHGGTVLYHGPPADYRDDTTPTGRVLALRSNGPPQHG